MTVSLGEFANAQQDWSYKTFGPPEHRGSEGPLNHLAKEVQEAKAAIGTPEYMEECADCLFLLVDAVHRSGFWITDLLDEAMKKLDKNKDRQWRDWRTLAPGEVSEHIKS